MPSNEGLWPVPIFRFRVTINGEEISFQEVSGLEVSTETVEYRHGDGETFDHLKIPSKIKTSNLVCKKGIFVDDEELTDLINELTEEKSFYSSEDEDDLFDIIVELLNESGETVKTWNIMNAFPIKYSVSGLNAASQDIAIEEIEFTYQGMQISIDGA